MEAPDASPPTEPAPPARTPGLTDRTLFRSVMLLAVLALGVVLVLYVDSWYRGGDGRVVDALEMAEGPPAGPVTPPPLPWTDVTAESGVDFVHFNGAQGQKLLPEAMGGGCAVLDYDRDGDPDLLFVNGDRGPDASSGEGSPRPTQALYRNEGSGRFANVTAEAGLDLSFLGMGVAAGDFDGDGWIDLFFTALGPNHLLQNRQGRFVEVTETAGVAGAPDAWSTAAAWLDYDRDGDLDLYVGNYVRWSPQLDAAQATEVPGAGRLYPPPTAFEGTEPYFYRNDGGGRFTDVTTPAAVVIRHPPSARPLAKTLGVLPTDLDGDGWIDLVVANDSVPNFFFRNERNGTFRERGAVAGLAFDANGRARAARGIDATWLRRRSARTIAIGNPPLDMTSLYVAQDDRGHFADESLASGLGPATRQLHTFGILCFDADLDGRQDLLLGNGHVEPEIARLQANQSYAQPPRLFWNAGAAAEREFIAWDAAATGADLGRPAVGRGAAYADWDGDGDLDLVLCTLGGAPRLLRNDQSLGNHWLRVKLLARSPGNRDALGAMLELHTSRGMQRGEVRPTRSYLSQVELPVTFGLGKTATIDKLVIRWPSGGLQTVPVPVVDQLIQIEEPPP